MKGNNTVYDTNISKKSNYNLNDTKKIDTKFIKINPSKKLQTIESEKNDNCFKSKIFQFDIFRKY